MTVMFILDGMACGTLERLAVPTLRQLRDSGVYYPDMELILPGHPAQNNDPEDPAYYPWGCSIANIPLMTGSVFVGTKGLKESMIQHSFGEAYTAFVVNDGAYEELRYGFDTYYRHGSTLDDQYDYASVLTKAKAIIVDKDPAFIRIHFQGPGSAGYRDYHAGRGIWSDSSVYIQEIERADAYLGKFVSWLKESGRWPQTVLIAMGDHGQNDEGWHAPYTGESQRQPVIFTGHGIRAGVVVPYAETIDIAPTIAHLHQIPEPAFSQGRVLYEALSSTTDRPAAIPERSLRQLNENLLNYHRQDSLRATAFPTLETIGSWHHRFGSIADVVEKQTNILRAENKSIAK